MSRTQNQELWLDKCKDGRFKHIQALLQYGQLEGPQGRHLRANSFPASQSSVFKDHYTRHFADWIRVVAASEVSIVLRFSCCWSGYDRRGKLFLLTTLYNTDSCACHIFGVYKSYRYSFSSIPLKWACSVTFLTSLFLSIVHPTAGRTEHLQNAFHDSTTNPGDIALAFYIGGWAYDGWWMRALFYWVGLVTRMRQSKRNMMVQVVL